MTEKVCAVEDKKEVYPWQLLVRSLLIIVCFLSLGLCSTLTGPTLLDLKDLMDTTVGAISFIFMLGSIGSVVGCFAVGLLMDKLIRLRYPLLGFTLLVMGVSNALLPFSPNLAAMYTANFFAGFASGAFDAGGQVLLLDIWKGRESGPYMHALHFAFGVGAFLAPVISKPFLSSVDEFEDAPESRHESLNLSESWHQHLNLSDSLHQPLNLSESWHHPLNLSALSSSRALVSNQQVADHVLSEPWNIKVLFPLVGTLPVILSTGFIFYYLLDLKGSRSSSPGEVKGKEERRVTDGPSGRTLVVLIVMMVFFFFYVGLEVAFGLFLTTFAVKCRLGLGRKEGSDITAVFWGSFAAVRGLAVGAAILLKPEIIMITSFLFCLVGSSLLSLWGETDVTLLYICSGAMGIGMASVFATGLLWLEKRVEITNRVGAAMAISSSLGAKIFPVLVGQIVEPWPIGFMYLMLGISTGCSLLFVLNCVLARGLELAAPLVSAGGTAAPLASAGGTASPPASAGGTAAPPASAGGNAAPPADREGAEELLDRQQDAGDQTGGAERQEKVFKEKLKEHGTAEEKIPLQAV